jgi:hypothetical protein
MTVFAYTRVSTDRQASEGESLDVQERTVAGYAMMHGLTVDSRLQRARGVGVEAPRRAPCRGRAAGRYPTG